MAHLAQTEMLSPPHTFYQAKLWPSNAADPSFPRRYQARAPYFCSVPHDRIFANTSGDNITPGRRGTGCKTRTWCEFSGFPTTVRPIKYCGCGKRDQWNCNLNSGGIAPLINWYAVKAESVQCLAKGSETKNVIIEPGQRAFAVFTANGSIETRECHKLDREVAIVTLFFTYIVKPVYFKIVRNEQFCSSFMQKQSTKI